jgi:hypothetical protein
MTLWFISLLAYPFVNGKRERDNVKIVSYEGAFACWKTGRVGEKERERETNRVNENNDMWKMRKECWESNENKP